MDLVKHVYRLTSALPEKERFTLVSQMNRAVISIPSNIAEGSGRTTEREFIRYLEIAISSSYELETQLLLINDLYASDVDDVLLKLDQIQLKIRALRKKLLSDESNGVKYNFTKSKVQMSKSLNV
jgi:four helix bundle protein